MMGKMEVLDSGMKADPIKATPGTDIYIYIVRPLVGIIVLLLLLLDECNWVGLCHMSCTNLSHSLYGISCNK